jgi:hypothetical protein
MDATVLMSRESTRIWSASLASLALRVLFGHYLANHSTATHTSNGESDS